MDESTRDSNAQAIHDRVITKIALSGIDLSRYFVGTNRGGDHDYPVRYVGIDGALYPDLVIMSRRTGRIQALYEVETEDTVTEEHARKEWKLFSSLGWKFILVVPKTKLTDALRLIDEDEIRVDHLGTYEVDARGGIVLDLPTAI